MLRHLVLSTSESLSEPLRLLCLCARQLPPVHTIANGWLMQLKDGGLLFELISVVATLEASSLEQVRPCVLVDVVEIVLLGRRNPRLKLFSHHE
jgi:hypothetical protein